MGRQKILHVLSDMDNTLFDFVHAKVEACAAVVDLIGTGDRIEMLSYFLRGVYGFENLENIEDYLKDKNVFSSDIYSECCAVYEHKKVENVSLYDGVIETIASLKEMGCSFIIVTDADTKNAQKRLKKVGLDKLVDDLVTFDMSGQKKPNPAVFHYALERSNAAPAQSLFIGDSLRRDIAPAKKIGMMTAHAAYGDRNDHDRDFLFEPDYTLNHISEVLKIIRERNRSSIG